MKRRTCMLMLLGWLLLGAAAAAEPGFAEVKRERVNFRESPGGARIAYLDAPQSVFVVEEETVNGALWCRVFTCVGKDNREGWIRGDMLRFVSDEFEGVVSVQAGMNYVTGVRADGTVAILGDDMPHMQCADEVRGWSDAAQVTSGLCGVYALRRDNRLTAIGRNSYYGAGTAGKLCGDEPILLDEAGCIMPENWNWAAEGQYAAPDQIPATLKGVPCAEALGYERNLFGALTTDGQVICTGGMAAMQPVFAHAPYVDADASWSHIVALRADGRVDAAGRYPACGEKTCDVSDWENVIAVAAGIAHTLGLKADGTVYYAGDDAAHARQVAGWTDVKAMDAGNGYSIALRADGSVVMAGRYASYFR